MALLLAGVPRQAGLPGARVWLVIVVAAPVLEEFVFRGGLQGWLYNNPVLRREPVPGLSYANLATSVIFAAVHLFSQPALWAASIFAPSLAYGYARDRTHSVWPCIVLHAWYNLGFVALFVR